MSLSPVLTGPKQFRLPTTSGLRIGCLGFNWQMGCPNFATEDLAIPQRKTLACRRTVELAPCPCVEKDFRRCSRGVPTAEKDFSLKLLY